MKKRQFSVLFSFILAVTFLFPQQEALAGVKEDCGLSNTGSNPDFSTMNCLLTETALHYNVPPEIVKAIAEGESGNWRQFDAGGNPIVTADGGIGVMQVTNQAQYDQQRLRSDVVYNIQAGVETLDKMFKRTDLPVIESGDRDILEHWYFAIMAYNGTKPVNSPVIQATGERNTNAYQEKIYDIVEEYGLINVQRLPFSRNDFNYDTSSSANITFETMQYYFNLPLTPTKHEFSSGQKAAAATYLNIRSEPTTSSTVKGTLEPGEKVTITGPFKYEAVGSRKNHFVWYPVKRSNGTTGYAASFALDYRFHDVPAGHYAEEEIYYLVNRNLLNGVGQDNFGLTKGLTRWQAVLLLNRVNNVSLANRPDPGFSDVPTDYRYYKDIAAAVDAGLFNGVSETEFRPEATLKRQEMAVLLNRLYQFPAATSTHPFTDVPAGKWYTDAVKRLYQAGVTAGISETRFGPEYTVTREQFAVFLSRAINENFRTN